VIVIFSDIHLECFAMNRLPYRLPALLLCALALWQLSLLPAHAQSPNTPRLAIPSYVSPASSVWTDWSSLGPKAVGIMILNRDNGDDISPDPGLAKIVSQTRHSGILVLGYIHTTYGRRDPAQIRAKIDGVYRNDHVDGIFLDETPTDCSAKAFGGQSSLAYYQSIASYIRTKPGKHLVVMNPGAMPSSNCWMSAADILVTFEEATLANYRKHYVDAPWTHAYSPNRFWNLVYSVPTAAQMQTIVGLARKRRVGWLYVTDDGAGGNPYNQPASYLRSEAASWTGAVIPPPIVRRQVSLQWSGMNAPHMQIFIATGQKHVPRYRVSRDLQADLMLQMPGDGSAQLLRYSGGGDDWHWTPLPAHAVLSHPQPGVTHVAFDADSLHAAPSVKIQFRLLNKAWNATSESKVFTWNPHPK
jgi:hypothetical protein